MHADQRQTSGHGEGADRLPVLLFVLGRLSGDAAGLPRCQEGLRKNASRQLCWWTCVRPKTWTFFNVQKGQEIRIFPGHCDYVTDSKTVADSSRGHKLDTYSLLRRTILEH